MTVLVDAVNVGVEPEPEVEFEVVEPAILMKVYTVRTESGVDDWAKCSRKLGCLFLACLPTLK